MKKNAFALILAIFVVVLFSALGVVAISLLSSEEMSVVSEYRGIQALHVAEAGVRYALANSIAGDSDWSDNADYSKTFDPGSFSITYISKAQDSVTLQSSGTVNGVTRNVRITLIRGGLPAAFSYGLYAGNQGGGPLIVQNSARVDGDFYYNGDVTMKNTSSLINGTLVSRSLTLQNSATCASWEPLPVPPVSPPTFDASSYTQILQATSHSASSALVLSGSSVLDLNGGTFYYTVGVINGSARINGPGTIVIKGSLAVQNSAVIGDSVRIIVGGAAAFQNSVSIGSSVEVYCEGDVAIENGQDFPRDNILYTNDDVTFNNSSYFYGTILAPHGNLLSVNSTKFRGIVYADSIDLQNTTNLRGSVVVDSVGYFSNSSTVTYDPSVIPSNWPSGLSGGPSGTSISNWQETY